MKKKILITIAITLAFVTSCASYSPDRYNTQKGAAIGAGAGALLGQAIGRNTKGTLIGLAGGTILGGLVGNAVDQDRQAAREAAQYRKQVVYYDHNGSAVEAIPGPVNQRGNCRTVTRRTWQDGAIVSETVEEVCSDDPAPPYRYRGHGMHHY
ncbi:MAG: glycine zipper 2TM domain-containing protein [Desulfobacteraceae bacterium]|nr:MAG: glycine zipper 2TM domain-containing protein [Desulfobacteraceae bacterium]